MLALANLAAWVVQTTILVAVALAAIRLLRLDAPAVRYHFLRALLVICLALPFVQPRVEQVVPRQQAPVAASAPSATRVWSSAPRELGSRMPLSLPDAALMLSWRPGWCCASRGSPRDSGACAGCGGLVRPPASLEACDDLASTVTRAASIRFVPQLGQPLTFGFRAPVILLPASLRSQPVPIQRAVLAHELWHVRRRDWLWTVCEEVLRAAALVPSRHLDPALAHSVGARRGRRRVEHPDDRLAPQLCRRAADFCRQCPLVRGDRVRPPAASRSTSRADLEGGRHVRQACRRYRSGRHRRRCRRRMVFRAGVSHAGRRSSCRRKRCQALPGPLEKQAARPITPENPDAAAELPGAAAEIRFENDNRSPSLSSREVTLDAAGHVAETADGRAVRPEQWPVPDG